MQLLHSHITDKIIRAFYAVHNKLGFGFLEKVYERALQVELRSMGLFVQSQTEIIVHYRGEEVGLYYPDLIVDGKVICELKSAEGIAEEHERQLLNYLKATEVEVGLLLNFGPKPQFKRKVFLNTHKHP